LGFDEMGHDPSELTMVCPTQKRSGKGTPVNPAHEPLVPLDSPEIFLNRELSWLAFARRVLELACDPALPILERVKFTGIMGMLHDEFFMKRMGGLKQQVRKGAIKPSLDGRTPVEELAACREEIRKQMGVLSRLMNEEILPALSAAGIPILAYADLNEAQKEEIRESFANTVLPILTPLAVDVEHPFPFISGQGLNLAIQIQDPAGRRVRFVRLKVPTNRPRWWRVPGSEGFVPLERIIAANLDYLFPGNETFQHSLFRVTRGSEADDVTGDVVDDSESLLPGDIIRQVTRDLKARRFAGIVREEVESSMPVLLRSWLADQLRVPEDDIYPTDTLLGLSDLLTLRVSGMEDHLTPPLEPVDHPSLRRAPEAEPRTIFDEIRRGDILVHHPYQSFDSSVLRLISEAAEDPKVLAIKLTIYRTSSDSSIIRALAEAARRGKQVAVLVEITARFDEAPNIAWGQVLEREGAHVAYGVEKLKTHVKLALVVRDEEGGPRSYVHVGTGNYHSGTARIYEDLGMLSADPVLCRDVVLLFNQLTGGLHVPSFEKLIVAPSGMRARFIELIGREADHVRAGRKARIRAKMNQLQDPDIIRELYKAGMAGVPVTLNVRGLCCLRPGVPGLSENIRVFSVVGRFLEHGRIYEFLNGGDREYYLGSADWMKRNLDRRVESIAPVEDPKLKEELSRILDVYELDNYSSWDCGPDGSYIRRRTGPEERRYCAQEVFAEMARAQVEAIGPAGRDTAQARED
jgi:polyphosphate kinase